MGGRDDVGAPSSFLVLRSTRRTRIVAQILGAGVGKVTGNCPPPLDQDLIVGSGRQQYASITWDDLFAIAPWLEETITRQIDGPGLGI
jgi:hypothetical protein